MCELSVHIPSRDAKAKEHMVVGTMRGYQVPMPAKKEPGETRMLCIRKPTKIVIRKIHMVAAVLQGWNTNPVSATAKALMALHGLRNVEATADNTFRLQFEHKGKKQVIYLGWLASGTKIDIGYPVKIAKPRAKAKKITGDKGVAAINKAIEVALKTDKPVVARGKAKKATKKRVAAK